MSRRGGRSPAWTIARTDLLQLRQARDFWVPLLILAALFFVVIPAVLLLLVSTAREAGLVAQLSDVVDNLPAGMRDGLRGDTAPAQASYTIAVSLFAPIAIVVPLTVVSAVGANTIVGERERGSGELLAHSPATEREVYVGKLLSALIPAGLAAALGFGAYSLVVDLIVGPKVGGWFFPTPQWWLLMTWVLPPFIALALAAVLAVSARVTSAAAAQQASGLVTLPLIVIAYGAASGTLFRTTGAVLVLGALAWVAAGVALFRGSRAVQRERLLGLGS